jgi:hypothetical protein
MITVMVYDDIDETMAKDIVKRLAQSQASRCFWRSTAVAAVFSRQRRSTMP